MSNNVTQVFSGDTGQLEKCFDRLAKKMDDMLAKHEKIAARTQETSRKATAAFDDQGNKLGDVFSKWGAGLASTAAGYVTLQSVISATNRLLAEQKQLQSDSLGANTGMAGIDAGLISNLGKGEDLEAARQRVRSMMSKFGVSDAGRMAEAVKFALSKSGGKAGPGLDALQESLGLTAKLPQETAPTAEAHLALQRVGLTKDQASDFIASAQSALPFAQQSDLTQRAISPVLAARSYYNKNISGIEVAKQHAALTGLYHLGGATPEVAAAGALGMEGALNDLFESTPALKAMDPGDFEGRMAILQGDQGLAKQLSPMLAKRLSRELQTDLPGRQLTDALGKRVISGELMPAYRGLKGGITTEGDVYEKMSAGLLGGTSTLEKDTADKRAEVANMLALESMDDSARMAIIRKNYEKIVKASAEYAPVASLGPRLGAGVGDWMGAWNASESSRADRARLLTGAAESMVNSIGNAGGDVANQRLGEMLEEMKRQTDLMKGNASAAAAAEAARKQ